ncbi:MAG: hypothetical protein AAGI66_02955 [Cyanobacteria bacterium P01_H01_bin.74]
MTANEVNNDAFSKQEQEVCSVMAGDFMAEMNEFAPELMLDYSVDSLIRLDQFITTHFIQSDVTLSDSVIYRTGCYLGEVIIRNMGGYWQKTATISPTASKNTMKTDHDNAPVGNFIIAGIRGTLSFDVLTEAEAGFSRNNRNQLSWIYHTLDKRTYAESTADSLNYGTKTLENHSNQGSLNNPPKGIASRLARLFGF